MPKRRSVGGGDVSKESQIQLPPAPSEKEGRLRMLADTWTPRARSWVEKPITPHVVSVDTPLGPDALVLSTMSGRDAMSAPFEYTLDLLGEDPNLPFGDLLGEPLAVHLELSRDELRHFHGHVASIRFVDSDRHGARYRAVLRPWLWRLTRTKNCRIFQRRSIPEIVDQVFRTHDLRDFEVALSEHYPPLEYVVQYRESDFDFVSRLLEDAGVYYYFPADRARTPSFSPTRCGRTRWFPGTTPCRTVPQIVIGPRSPNTWTGGKPRTTSPRGPRCYATSTTASPRCRSSRMRPRRDPTHGGTWRSSSTPVPSTVLRTVPDGRTCSSTRSRPRANSWKATPMRAASSSALASSSLATHATTRTAPTSCAGRIYPSPATIQDAAGAIATSPSAVSSARWTRPSSFDRRRRPPNPPWTARRLQSSWAHPTRRSSPTAWGA